MEGLGTEEGDYSAAAEQFTAEPRTSPCLASLVHAHLRKCLTSPLPPLAQI